MPNSQVYFMISVGNNSAFSVNNASVLASIPQEISSLGNLQLNGVPVSGDIVTGVSVAALAPYSSQTLTFEGKTQGFTMQSDKQAIAKVTVSGNIQSDFISLTFAPLQSGAAVSATPQTPGFVDFLKRWYLWILAALVLVFLFFVVFRRLSKN